MKEHHIVSEKFLESKGNTKKKADIYKKQLARKAAQD